MTDSEIYPVSFFSQAFDLMHKIESDFHALEADQVELFASQMKKHRALILSIHQQIRHIDAPSTKNITAETVRQSVAEKESPLPQKEKVAGQQEDQQKKVSFLSRLGFSKEPIVNKEPVTDRKQTDSPPPKKASKIIEVPIEKIIPTPRPAAPKTAETTKTPESKTGNGSNGIPAEGSAPPSVNDIMEKRKLSDLRKAFSLNDRFRYCRELFGGSEEVMSKVITTLNNKDSYKESMLFLEEKLHWDFTNPTVKDFIKVLEIRFL